MTVLLVVLTVVEVVVVLAVLVTYLVKIMRSLQTSARHFSKIAFGVRAIETQVASAGPAVRTLNEELEQVTVALPSLSRRVKG